MFGEDNRAPTHSQFAFRVSVLGGFALLAFAVIFFRLWFVEVLSGEAYLREANSNRVRDIPIQAPRGRILDANGHVLVGNRTVLALQVRPDRLPKRNDARNAGAEEALEARRHALRQDQEGDQGAVRSCCPRAR